MKKVKAFYSNRSTRRLGGQLLEGMSSLRVTVICLIFYFILVAWGTLYQVEYGLYAAQKRFFYAWVFMIGGWIPFPGAQLVSLILGSNLLSAACRMKFAFRWSKLGILGVHYGLITLLLGSAVVHFTAEESYLSLAEGEASNLRADYHLWELAFWIENAGESPIRETYAYEVSSLRRGEAIRVRDHFKDFPLDLAILPKRYYSNSVPRSFFSLHSSAVTEDGILLRSMEMPKELNAALAGLEGVLLHREGETMRSFPFSLWGGHDSPLYLRADGKKIGLILRHKRSVLPFTMELLEFKKESYLGVDLAKSYESRVLVDDGKVKRSIRIYMNHPFRWEDYTFYQASYSRGGDEKVERSIFAVVKNRGRWLPYVSGLMISLGLLVHFGRLLGLKIFRDKLRRRDRKDV